MIEERESGQSALYVNEDRYSKARALHVLNCGVAEEERMGQVILPLALAVGWDLGWEVLGGMSGDRDR